MRTRAPGKAAMGLHQRIGRAWDRLLAMAVHRLELAEVDSHACYCAFAATMKETYRRRTEFELRAIKNRSRFSLDGHCYACGRRTVFDVDCTVQEVVHGNRVPQWREQLICRGCTLSNRFRASLHLFARVCAPAPDDAIFITEQVTPLFRRLKKSYPGITGSEYLGGTFPPGAANREGIRNEDLTRLSFADNTFDFILSFDVLEHIPDYTAALAECLRCLKPGGRLLFSVPFWQEYARNLVRARVGPRGEIEHLHPPDYHGDPLRPGKGSLSYYIFGWELLDVLRDLGYADAHAILYWSSRFGYLGIEQVAFVAEK